jgi:hypothetical protein
MVYAVKSDGTYAIKTRTARTLVIGLESACQAAGNNHTCESWLALAGRAAPSGCLLVDRMDVAGQDDIDVVKLGQGSSQLVD